MRGEIARAAAIPERDARRTREPHVFPARRSALRGFDPLQILAGGREARSVIRFLVGRVSGDAKICSARSASTAGGRSSDAYPDSPVRGARTTNTSSPRMNAAPRPRATATGVASRSPAPATSKSGDGVSPAASAAASRIAARQRRRDCQRGRRRDAARDRFRRAAQEITRSTAGSRSCTMDEGVRLTRAALSCSCRGSESRLRAS